MAPAAAGAASILWPGRVPPTICSRDCDEGILPRNPHPFLAGAPLTRFISVRLGWIGTSNATAASQAMLHRPRQGPCAPRMQGLHLNAAKRHLSRYTLSGCTCIEHLSACIQCRVSTCSRQQHQCLAPRVMFCPADSAAPYRSRPSLLSSACRMAPCSMELCNGEGRGEEVV